VDLPYQFRKGSDLKNWWDYYGKQRGGGGGVRLETSLIKWSLFWSMIIFAWTALWYHAYHYSWMAIAAIAAAWIVFLIFLFGRILPNARK